MGSRHKQRRALECLANVFRFDESVLQPERSELLHRSQPDLHRPNLSGIQPERSELPGICGCGNNGDNSGDDNRNNRLFQLVLDRRRGIGPDPAFEEVRRRLCM
jgi:hypothetical protein